MGYLVQGQPALSPQLLQTAESCPPKGGKQSLLDTGRKVFTSTWAPRISGIEGPTEEFGLTSEDFGLFAKRDQRSSKITAAAGTLERMEKRRGDNSGSSKERLKKKVLSHNNTEERRVNENRVTIRPRGRKQGGWPLGKTGSSRRVTFAKRGRVAVTDKEEKIGGRCTKLVGRSEDRGNDPQRFRGGGKELTQRLSFAFFGSLHTF